MSAPAGASSSRPWTPEEMAVAGQAVVLFGPDGKPARSDQYRAPWSVGPMDPWAVQWGERPPQSWDYPLSANRIFTPRAEEAVPSFKKLRWLADWCDYVRIAIEYRKDQFAAKEWSFRARGARNSRQRRSEMAKDIKTATDFWLKPDRINGFDWPAWVKQVLEEMFVTDGVRLYKWRDLLGRLYALFQVEPGIMKPVKNTFGVVNGWQQVILGFPRTQYAVESIVADQYSPRVDSDYGTSHLEDIAQTIEVAIRKIATELAMFTEGSVPIGFIAAPQGWTGKQIEAFQNFTNASLSGNDSAKVRLRIVPYGATYVPAKPYADMFNRDHEEALISRVCARFGMNRSIFITTPNRSTTDTVEASLTDAGHQGAAQFIAGIVNKVTWEELGLTEIEWGLTDEASRDLVKQAQASKLYVDMGAIHSEEVREDLGYDPEEVNDEDAGPSAQDLTLPILQASVLTVNEARAALKLAPLPGDEGARLVAVGGEFLTPKGAALKAAESEDPKPEPRPLPAIAATAAAAKPAPEPLPSEETHNAAPKSGAAGVSSEPKPVAVTVEKSAHGTTFSWPAVPGAVGYVIHREPVVPVATFSPLDFGGPDDESPDAASERGKWERFALKRFGKSNVQKAAHQFTTAALSPWEAYGIRHALRKAESAREVTLIFKRAKKRLTSGAKEKAVRALKGHAQAYLDSQRALVMDHAKDALSKAKTKRHHDSKAADAFRSRFSETAGHVWLGAAQDVADDLRDTTLDFDYFDKNALKYATERGGELITEIDQTTLDRVEKLIAEGVESGWSIEEFADHLEESGMFGEARSELIARSELAFAQNNGMLSTAKELGVTKVHVFDGDGCAPCAEANGQVWDIDDAEENDLEHPNCLAEGSALVLAPYRELGYSRPFDGKVIVLRTATDQLLTVTPNHPVLTDKGWRAAKLIKQGDYVISSPRERELAALVDPYHDDAPSPIEQVAATPRMPGQMTARTMKAAAEHFHGDGAGSKIYVERTLGLLGARRHPALPKQASEPSLLGPHVQTETFSRHGASFKLFGRHVAPANGIVSGCALGQSLGGGHLGGAKDVSFGGGTGYPGVSRPLPDGSVRRAEERRNLAAGHSVVEQLREATIRRALLGTAGISEVGADKRERPRYGIRGDADAASKFLCRFPGLVSATKVISVEPRDYSGHVHNLQTREGWYLANGIVTHNCERSFSPAASDEEDNEEAA